MNEVGQESQTYFFNSVSNKAINSSRLATRRAFVENRGSEGRDGSGRTRVQRVWNWEMQR